MPCLTSNLYENEGHNIEKIDILKHINGLGSKADTITTGVMTKQSLDVDIVAGARPLTVRSYLKRLKMR